MLRIENVSLSRLEGCSYSPGTYIVLSLVSDVKPSICSTSLENKRQPLEMSSNEW